MELFSSIPVVISLVSLFLAIVTLILTQLRPPTITATVGPEVQLSRTTDAGEFCVAFPVSFINHGARTGLVERASIEFYHSEQSSQRFYMHWNSFLETDIENLRFVHGDYPNALLISGKSAVSRRINFAWLASSQPRLHITQGSYRLVLYFSVAGRSLRRTKDYKIPITLDQANILNGESSATINVTLDETLKVNECLNEFQQHQLLGHAKVV